MLGRKQRQFLAKLQGPEFYHCKSKTMMPSCAVQCLQRTKVYQCSEDAMVRIISTPGEIQEFEIKLTPQNGINFEELEQRSDG